MSDPDLIASVTGEVILDGLGTVGHKRWKTCTAKLKYDRDKKGFRLHLVYSCDPKSKAISFKTSTVEWGTVGHKRWKLCTAKLKYDHDKKGFHLHLVYSCDPKTKSTAISFKIHRRYINRIYHNRASKRLMVYLIENGTTINICNKENPKDIDKMSGYLDKIEKGTLSAPKSKQTVYRSQSEKRNPDRPTEQLKRQHSDPHMEKTKTSRSEDSYHSKCPREMLKENVKHSQSDDLPEISHRKRYRERPKKPEQTPSKFDIEEILNKGNVKHSQSDDLPEISHRKRYRERPKKPEQTPSKFDIEEILNKGNRGSGNKLTRPREKVWNSNTSEKSKSTDFLARGQEKSRKLETPQTVSSFYKSSENSTPRLFGTFGSHSSTMKRPGLLHPSSKSKKPRMSSDAENYVWRKAQLESQSKTKSLQGFSNLGNTCYMNAILQALFSLETFSADLRNETLHSKMSQDSLFKSLAELLNCRKAHNCLPEKRELALKLVKKAISSTAKRFSGYEQHDAHEFLNQVLDQLKEEVIKANKSATSPEKRDETLRNQEELLNPTSVNFEFQIIHTITCQKCHGQVTKTEIFYDLSVDMPRKYKNSLHSRTISLQDALDNFLRKEIIEYTCEECKHTKAEVTHKFSKLPRVLILHLKRYSFNAMIETNVKMSRDINIPKFITLSNHCEEETSPPQPPVLILTPQKKPRKSSEFDTPDGTRRRLDYSRATTGVRVGQYTFHSLKRNKSDSDSGTETPGKARVDMQTYKALEDSLKESMKQEEQKRQEELELEAAMKQSRMETHMLYSPESLGGATGSKRADTPVKNDTFGYVSPDQLRKMSEEEKLELALRQSELEAQIQTAEVNGDLLPTKKNVPNNSDSRTLECRESRVSETESDSDSDILLTGLRQTSKADVPPRYGKVIEHKEVFSGESDLEFKVYAQRPGKSPKGKTDVNGNVLNDKKSSDMNAIGQSKKGSEDLFEAGPADSVLMGLGENSAETWRGTPDASHELSSEDERPTKQEPNISGKERSPVYRRFTYSKAENKRLALFTAQLLKERELELSGHVSGGFDVVDGIASSRKRDAEGSGKSPVEAKSGKVLTKRRTLGAKDESSCKRDAEGSGKSPVEATSVKDLKSRRLLESSRKRDAEGSGKSPVEATSVKVLTSRRSLGAKDEVDLTCPADDPMIGCQPLEGSSAPTLSNPETDWLSDNYKTEQDQLKEAMQKSLLEQGPDQSNSFEDELKKAKELSLQEYGAKFLVPDVETDENENEVERSEEEYKILQQNAEDGSLAYSYQLTSVVCHLGSSSSVGHYVSDVYDIRKQAWYSYDDKHVEETTEKHVRSQRKKSGNIFFYMNSEDHPNLGEDAGCSQEPPQKKKRRSHSEIKKRKAYKRRRRHKRHLGEIDQVQEGLQEKAPKIVEKETENW